MAVIVVGYSSRAEGRAALSRAITEAQLRGAELLVVHTSPDGEVAELRSVLDASGIAYTIASTPDTEDPADELISAAEREDAEFIVIGLRRRSPIGKLLLGSNAQKVLLDAACPVLAVKAAPET
jgi:nucleotide-binding universal stress UspA family protein